MKISFILAGDATSGGIKAPIQAASELLQRGHNVRLLVNHKQESVKAHIRYLYLRMRYHNSVSWLQLFKGKIERFIDLKQCKFEENEVVVAHGWWAQIELRQLKENGIIKVHYIHGVVKNDLAKDAWNENVPKIAVASYLRDAVKEISGQEVLAVIPNGIDTTKYFPSVPENQRNGVGTIFGMGYHKDPQTVLSVLQELHRTRPEVPLRVFGACRKPKEISRQQYLRLPSLEKARQIYSLSLVWFLGSRSEGFSLPVLEAMACGCAVVATDCGGPRDIITDGDNGFLVGVGDAKQITDRIKMLLDDPELRQQFVQKSRETVNKFSWNSSVNELEKVLYSIVKARQAQQWKAKCS
jgi:glycosyltransferase involved in cell wall biosynthesis